MDILEFFGCVCYPRTEVAGRKKLDDRSKVLVHLGPEPGSKEYRLLDPLTKRIIVSRDIYFDEERYWSWNTGESNQTNNYSSFEIELIPLTGTESSREARAMSKNNIEDDKNEEEPLEDDEKSTQHQLIKKIDQNINKASLSGELSF